MKTHLKCLFVAVIVIMFCLPVTAFAKPHHPNGGRHHSNHNNHASHYVQQCGMSNSQFSTFVSLVNNTTFRSQKLEVIKAAAASNTFTVSQVIQTMNLMSFSSDKIDVAAAMYNNVCDRNNWYMVYSVFDFSTQVKALKRKIGEL